MISKILLRYIFHQEEDVLVFLGTKQQKGSMFAPVRTLALWKQEPWYIKILSIMRLKWIPNPTKVEEKGIEIFKHDIFGSTEDWGDNLLNLMAWHNSRDWKLNHLTDMDLIKAEALDALVILTRIRYEETSSALRLKLKNYVPSICALTHPMVVKFPVVSLQYFLTIHSAFAFNSIRKANYQNADDIISFLYETLFIQQKTALSIHEFARLTVYTEKQKNEALFINAEVNCITSADLVFTYLKASIEKIISIVGLTYGIKGLDTKKTHKQKISALENGIPKEIKEQYYYQYLLDMIQSENIDELSNYRSGLLHKKGISDLQPHTYVGAQAQNLPLKKIFLVLHEQHSKNTSILIAALALLTDELVKIDHPDVIFSDIPPFT